MAGAVQLPPDGPILAGDAPVAEPAVGPADPDRFRRDTRRRTPLRATAGPGLLVGDMSQPRGGPMLTGHASHQVGLDADIWLNPMPSAPALRARARGHFGDRDDRARAARSTRRPLDAAAWTIDPPRGSRLRASSEFSSRPASRRSSARRREPTAAGSTRCGPITGTTIISMSGSRARRDALQGAVCAAARRRLRRGPRLLVQRRALQGAAKTGKTRQAEGDHAFASCRRPAARCSTPIPSPAPLPCVRPSC